MNLPMLREDRANHFIYGIYVGLAVQIICALIGTEAAHFLLIPAAGFMVGLGKEALDHVANQRAIEAGVPETHGVQGVDLLWTFAGSVIVAAAAFIQHGGF